MQVPNANLASSIFGAADAKQRDAAAKLRAKRQEPQPELDRPFGHEAVAKTEAVEKTRTVKGNGQEESREDRQEHGAYDPHREPVKRRPPSIDTEA
jgi:hypothetical protein